MQRRLPLVHDGGPEARIESCDVCGAVLDGGGRCAACLFGVALGAEADAPESALRLRGYAILGTLGRGGMGTVYRARQSGSERIVALKMVQARHIQDEVVRERFRSEVKLIGALSHPNVLPLYESGVQDGVPYFSMQLAEGGTLAEEIARGPLAPRRAAELVESVARAVHHAHQRGVLHRDLKPANILLGADGTPYVSDFGVARALDDTSHGVTLTGAVVGSPGYMAPEQAAGSGAALTTAADVFGLGAILFAALTGRAPFVAETPLATVRLASETEAPRLRVLRAELPRDLEVIVAKALAPEPAARYASAGELAEELRRWLEGRPIQARRASAVENAWRWARRNPLAASLAAGLALLVAAGLAGVGVANVRLAKSRDEARAAEQAAKERLFESKIEQARAARRVGQRAEALAALEQARVLGPSEKLRDEMIGALALAALEPAEVLPWQAPIPARLVVDKQLRRVAVADGSELTIRALDDGRILQRLPLPAGEVQAFYGFSAKGNYLAARVSESSSCVWDLATGQLILRQAGPPMAGHFSLAFSPDEARVALGRAGGNIAIYRLAAPAESEREFPTEESSGLAWSPDGSRLASICESQGWRDAAEAHLTVHRLPNGEHDFRISRPRGFIDVAWSGDGGTLAAASWDATVQLYETGGGREIGQLLCHEPGIFVKMSASGKLLSIWGNDGATEIWDVPARRIIGTVRGQAISEFSPGGDRVALRLSNGRVVWHRLHRSDFYRELAGSPQMGRTLNLRTSRDGEWLALSGLPGVRVVDLRSFDHIDLPRPDESETRLGAAFLPDFSALVISSRGRGLARYPLTLETPADGTRRQLRFGPVEWILEMPRVYLSSITPNGRAVLTTGWGGGDRWAGLLELQPPGRMVEFKLPEPGADCTVSADGALVSTGHWRGGVRIWNAHSGKFERTISPEEAASGDFSPDGRWLITRSAQAYRMWEIHAGWVQRHTIPGPEGGFETFESTFSPDGRMLALCLEPGVIQLLEVPSWRPLARLLSPRPLRNAYLNFARGGRLLVVAGNGQELQFWDLEVLGRELVGRGLSW